MVISWSWTNSLTRCTAYCDNYYWWGISGISDVNDRQRISHIRMRESLSGERYLASIERDGQEESNGKDFDSPDDALKWIEKHR